MKQFFVKIWRAKMFGSKFREEIFGEKILLNEKKMGGGGRDGEQFHFKANFLERKFWGPSFGGEILVRRKFRQQKYFGGIFVSKIHCQKKYGEQKCLTANSLEEKFGEQILLDEN